MALVDSNEVKLAISAETIGAGDVADLARQIDALAGESEQAAQALAPLAKEIEELGQKKVVIDGLKEAIDAAKQARAAFAEARDRAAMLDKALAEAKGANAHKKVIGQLNAELGRANALFVSTERAWLRQNDALKAARATAQAAGIDTRNLAREEQRLAGAIDQARGRVDNLRTAMAPVPRDLKNVGQGARDAGADLDKLGNASDGLNAKLKGVAGAMAGLFAVARLKGYVGDMIGVADAYGQMATRIGMATSSAEEYDLVQRRLLESANRTYRPLAEAQETFIRTSGALRSLNYTTEQALDITDSFSYLLTTNAASAEKAQNALNAYTKSLMKGSVDTKSWQSILAATPTVVDAIARSSGKSAAEIRALGAAGKLAAADLNEALRQSVELNKAAAESMPTTVADAITSLANTWSVYIGEANRANGATAKLVDYIGLLRDNLDTVVRVATLSGEIMVAAFGVRAVMAVSKYAGAIRLATAETAALQVSTAAAVKNAGLLASAGKLAAAGWVGWEIGTYLRKEFDVVNRAGIALAAGLHKAAVRAKGGWEAFLAVFTDDTYAAVTQRVADEIKRLDETYGEMFAEVAKAAEGQKQATDNIGTAAERAAQSANAALIQLTKTNEQLKELSATDLSAFADQLEAAFKLPDPDSVLLHWSIAAEDFARINDQILTVSFENLGANGAQALGRVSTAAQAALDNLDNIARALTHVDATAIDTGAALAAAIAKATDTADSRAALAALEAKIREMGQAGRISGTQVAAALDRIRSKSDDLTPGINSVAEAMKQLGITSDAELKRAAAAAREAWQALKNMGGSTREIEAGFRKYAEAAVTANKGVADTTLKAEGAQQGLKVATDGTVTSLKDQGAAAKKSGDGADEAGSAVRNMGDAAEQAGKKTAKAGEEMRGAGLHGAWMAAMLNEAVQKIRAVSEHAADVVDALRNAGYSVETVTGHLRSMTASANDLIREDALGKLNTELAELEKGAESARAAAESLDYLATYSGHGWRQFYDQVRAMSELEASLYRARAEMKRFDIEVQKHNDTFAEGNENLRAQERLLEGLVRRAEALGSERLSELRGALRDVRQQFEAITESARSSLDAVQDELDQMQGNQAEIERRRRERELQELRQQLAEAEQAGNAEAIALLNEAVRKQSEVSRLKIEEARAREKAAQAERQTAPSGSAASGAPVTTRRVELKLGQRTHTVTTDAAGERALDALLSELETAAGVAQ